MKPAVFFLACASALAAPQTFEVASVKPAPELTPGSRAVPLDGGPGTKSPGRLAGTATMKSLLIRAYGVAGYQISGPAWMETERFEIAASIPAGTTKEQTAVMLQNLLVERFHLAVHRETKETVLFALLVGKNGPKLKETDPAAAAEGEKIAATGANFPRPKVTMGADGFPEIPADAKIPGTFTLSLSSGQFLRTKLFARNYSMDKLANTIGDFINRPVKNLTELAGQYDFTLAFESDPLMVTGETKLSSASVDAGPTIFAGIQEQLGLRLEQRKGAVEMVIVDRVERVPVEN